VELDIYTRVGCHLCDDAIALVGSFGFEPNIVDIDIAADARPELLANYDKCVPVVVIDGKVRFRGKVDPVLLKRLIEANR